VTLALASAAFQPGAKIPKRHTGEGADVSPPLAWSGLPPGTRELALIGDDPDAPRPAPWVHWVIYGIPITVTEFKEGLTGTGIEGTNDFGNVGYGGPMPPKGHGVHRYFFRLYALDKSLAGAPGWTKERLLSEMKGHVLEVAELMGTYERA
jgi:Raf kinase inhibitor-like YbhB/YbcL family protein